MLHKSVPPQDRHAPHSFEYSNAAARLAATGFVAADVGKIALQLDNMSHWILSSYSPITWVSTAANTPGSVTSIFGSEGVVSQVDYIRLNTGAAAGAAIVGKTFWDDANGTLATTLKGGNVTLQHGQELHVPAKNITGSQINDGKVVYISGGTLGDTNIALAQANSTVQSDGVIGVATENIPNNSTGFVTAFGYVNNINTSAFSANDIIWLSDSVAGGMTNVRPKHPNNAVKIGTCTYSHATLGRIHVSPQKYANASDIELPTVGTPVDVVDVLDWFRHSWSTGLVDGGSITNNGDGTINIAASDIILRKGSNSDSDLAVFRDSGVTNLSLAANDVSYVFLNYNSGSPVWQTSTSISGFNGIDKVVVYVIGRNGNTLNIIDLRQINVDAQRKSRRQKAEFDGYAYKGWYRSVEGQSPLSSSGLNLLIGSGKYFYFDNPVTHTAFDTSVVGTSLPNKFTYFYNRSGAWTQIADQKTINNTQFDSAGSLTTLSNNKFRTDWVFVVLCGSAPYLAVVMGDAQYSSIAEAKAAPTPTIPPQIDGICVLVGQACVMKSDTTLSTQKAVGSTFNDTLTPQSHITLTDLLVDSHTQYVLANGTRDISGPQKFMNNIIIPKTSGFGIQLDTTTPVFGWKDLTSPIRPKSSGVGSPTRSIYRGGTIAQYSFDVGDVADIEFHLPHDYLPGSDIFLHVHWSHNGTSISGNASFEFFHTYAKGHNQEAFPAEKTITFTYNTTSIANMPRYQHRIDEFPLSASTPTATLMDRNLLEPDGVILVTVRLAAKPTISGGSPNNPFIHFVDIHYQSTLTATKNKSPNFWA